MCKLRKHVEKLNIDLRWFYPSINMAVESESLVVHNVIRSLERFSGSVTVVKSSFSNLNSEVLHVPLNDSGSILKLMMFGNLFHDDFTSHLNYLKEMSIRLETADSSPITLTKLKSNVGGSHFKGKVALKRMTRIRDEVVKESLKQISQLKDLASAFKTLKEGQKTTFETGSDENSQGKIKKALISKMKAFLADEARKAFFESDLETAPEVLLNHLAEVEKSLQDLCDVTCSYVEVLQTFLDKMGDVKSEDKEDVILGYLSGIKDAARELIEECERCKNRQS